MAYRYWKWWSFLRFVKKRLVIFGKLENLGKVGLFMVEESNFSRIDDVLWPEIICDPELQELVMLFEAVTSENLD